MSQRNFYVRAIWDDEAKVFVSDSNIIGLNIEAETIEQFEEVLFDAAVELIVANHLSKEDVATKPLRDLIPGVIWQRPDSSVLQGV